MRLRIFLWSMALITLVGCSKGTLHKDVVIGSETIPVVMPSGDDIIHPQYGKEVFLAVGSLAGVNAAKANGVADMHVFEKNATIASVKLNIEQAPAGSRYVAWLQKPGSSERVRLGELQNPLGDVRHSLAATVEKDLRDYTQVIVTLERAAGPSDSDMPHAEGMLKAQQR